MKKFNIDWPGRNDDDDDDDKDDVDDKDDDDQITNFVVRINNNNNGNENVNYDKAQPTSEERAAAGSSGSGEKPQSENIPRRTKAFSIAGLVFSVTDVLFLICLIGVPGIVLSACALTKLNDKKYALAYQLSIAGLAFGLIGFALIPLAIWNIIWLCDYLETHDDFV